VFSIGYRFGGSPSGCIQGSVPENRGVEARRGAGEGGGGPTIYRVQGVPGARFFLQAKKPGNILECVPGIEPHGTASGATNDSFLVKDAGHIEREIIIVKHIR
jgi:hypothetical protein